MPMILLETKILNDSIQMRYADNPDPTQAAEWLEFRAKLLGLVHPYSRGGPQPLGNPEEQFVSESELAALRYMRDVIGEETQRLSNLVGRIR
jgi:hypothetical protein